MSLPIRWQARRPEPLRQVLARARERERRVVVQQRVPPDVEDLLGVPRDRDAPAEAAAAERDVLQAALDERERLVVAHARLDEVGALGEQALERLLERRQPEEPVVLVLARQRDLVDRAGVALGDLALGLEVRAARAVPALVHALVGVAVVLHARQDLLDLRDVARVARADEEVVASRRAAARAPGSARSCGRRARRGVTPSRSAASFTGSPCSSVPVRKKTSCPRWR